MKILLIGEYSNVHATLAEGLRLLGHKVTVVSNGDFWKNYPRDIDLTRQYGKFGGLRYVVKLCLTLPKMRNYDIVQLINPMFLEIKAEHIFKVYNYLRKHNKKVILCGFGMDWYWVHTCCCMKPLRYSDFNMGDNLRNDANALKERKEWLGTTKENLNKYIAEDCDGIVTGLYEYWICYNPAFPKKTVFIPFPIKEDTSEKNTTANNPIRIFIGISKSRSEYKGTDIMLRAAMDVKNKYPEKMELQIAEGVPFAEYEKMMNGSDAILDQLYSYTPSMNPLLAMSKGIICIGGGETENYEIINEKELRPIINVAPNYESVYEEIENLVLHPKRIPQLKKESIEYVKRHHEYVKVAKQYERFYNDLLFGKNS